MERYYSFAEYCRKTFHKKLYRAALDAGMTCPNRDGTKGTRGCIFCSAAGSGDFAVRFDGGKLEREDLIYNHQDAEEGSFIAYFQSFTNTYAPAEKLYRLYAAALNNPLFAGISIATRPDCVSGDVITVLKRLREEYPDKFIWVELGLQSIHETSASWMRRSYQTEEYDQAARALHEAGTDIITHIIIGLPGEGKEEILETVRHVNTIGTDGIKIHLLHYLEDSDLGQEYLKDPDKYHMLEEEEYIDIVCECIASLDPDTVIHRLTGDGNGETLIGPHWSRDKRHVLNRIRHTLKEKNITQGCRAIYENQ